MNQLNLDPSKKVKGITDAFSMQPACHFVDVSYGGQVAEIKLESVCIGTECGDPVIRLMYVGYGVNGDVLFHSLATSVNVEYL